MNLDNKENKETKKLTGLADISKKTSTFNMKGMKKPSSFLERLHNMSKKDIAMVAMGLSVLVMAPVAEYFMSKPGHDNVLTPGFGERKSSDSAGPNLYDSGVNALSAGSPNGSSDVIVPLTARDPSSLIVGPQSSAPTPPPVAQTSFRDSMKDLASNSFSQALKSSPAPFIPPRMASNLRGMSSFFSGGEGTKTGERTISGSNIIASAQGVSKTTEKRSMAGPVAIPGYKGVASSALNSSSKDAMEKLRGQADKAANFFNTGSAVKGLEKAGEESVMAAPGDKSKGLTDTDGINRPSNSNNSSRGSYSPGDPCKGSLAVQLACEEAKENAKFNRQLKQDLIKTLVESISKPFGDKISDSISGLLNPTAPPKPVGYCKLQSGEVVPIYSSGKNKDGNPTFTPYAPKDCPGTFTTKDPNAPATDPAGNASDSVSPQDIKSIEDAIAEYDTFLYDAKSDIVSSGEKDKEKLLSGSELLIKAFQKAVNINSQINGALTKVDSAISTYQGNVTSMNNDFTSAKSEFDSFKNKVENILILVSTGKLESTMLINGTTVAIDLTKVGESTSTLKDEIEKIKKENDILYSSYTIVGNILDYHVKNQTFYSSQMTKIKSKLSELETGYSKNITSIDGIKRPLLEQSVSTQAIKEAYDKLVDQSKGDVPMQYAILYRGATSYLLSQIENNFSGKKFNDEALTEEENKYTGQMPYTKLITDANYPSSGSKDSSSNDASKGNSKSIGNKPTDNQISESFKAAYLRGLVAIPKDVEGMKRELDLEKAKLDAYKAQIAANKKKLRDLGIPGFDDTPNNPNNGNGGNINPPVNPSSGTINPPNNQSSVIDMPGDVKLYKGKLDNVEKSYERIEKMAASTNLTNKINDDTETEVLKQLKEVEDAHLIMDTISQKTNPNDEDKKNFEEAKKRFDTAQKKFNEIIEKGKIFAKTNSDGKPKSSSFNPPKTLGMFFYKVDNGVTLTIDKKERTSRILFNLIGSASQDGLATYEAYQLEDGYKYVFRVNCIFNKTKKAFVIEDVTAQANTEGKEKEISGGVSVEAGGSIGIAKVKAGGHLEGSRMIKYYGSGKTVRLTSFFEGQVCH